MSFTDHGDGVRLVAEDRISGTWRTLCAQWLVGCDGAASTVRAGAGLEMQGPTGLGHFLSVRFQAPLGEVVVDRASTVYFVSEPVHSSFMAIDNDRRWIYQYPFDPRQEPLDAVTDHDLVARLIRTATGLPQLELTIQNTMTWRMDAQLANAYRNSRILLAGDVVRFPSPAGTA